jgi:N-acyl amino acid synthase of PEP-CTERM/exosortase system
VEQVLDEFNSYFFIDSSESIKAREDCYRLRYQVYCEEREIFNKNNYDNKMEIDEYDVHSGCVLLRHQLSGIPSAMVRVVLPENTKQSHGLQVMSLLKNIHGRDLWNDLGLNPDTTGEISRFTVSNTFRRRSGEANHIYGYTPTERDFHESGGRRLYPFITIGLFKSLFEISHRYGLESWVAAMEPGLIRLLSRFGVSLQKIGKPINYYGRRQPCYGNIIDVSKALYRKRPEVWRFATNHGQYYPFIDQLDSAPMQTANPISTPPPENPTP